jgi:cyanate permease
MNGQDPRGTTGPMRLALIVFLGVAGYYLWMEHRAHLWGVLPLLLPLVVCLGMHLFMHRRHGGHHHRRGEHGARDDT